MTTLAPEADLIEIDWDNLVPLCDAEGCENPGDFPVEHRHLEPVNCEEERRTWWICKPCYDYIGRASTACVVCEKPASIFKM